MNELYHELLTVLKNNLSILEDKPEETIESTLKALWHKASGTSISAEKALQTSLPMLSEAQEVLLNNLIAERLSGTPLAHITGRQNFMGLELISDKRALIPRKETEILGKTANKICKSILNSQKKIYAMDVCCGSGNLGIALASLIPDIQVYSSDLSFEAVELTMENIQFTGLKNRVSVVQSDLFSSFESDQFLNKMDIIICNPPYISSSKVLKMNEEIANNEPSLAFDGGMIGLKVIQNLIKESPRFLTPYGWLVFEVGLGQGPFVTQLCQKSGAYQFITSAADEQGNIRVIAASRSADQSLYLNK